MLVLKLLSSVSGKNKHLYRCRLKISALGNVRPRLFKILYGITLQGERGGPVARTETGLDFEVL